MLFHPAKGMVAMALQAWSPQASCKLACRAFLNHQALDLFQVMDVVQLRIPSAYSPKFHRFCTTENFNMVLLDENNNSTVGPGKISATLLEGVEHSLAG